MATWTTVYLIVGIVVGALGLWHLARRGDPYLCVTGILWFLVTLFRLYVPGVWTLVIVQGLPSVGSLLLYLAVPVFLALALIGRGARR
jgi:hypothetical protein